MNYDVIVIGGGVVGCSILRKLSYTNLKCLLIEKESDVSMGASKANSGIIHAGYDAEEGTLKAKFNVRGCQLYEELSKEFNFPYKKIGSLVLAKENGYSQLEKLYERGKNNGVKDLEILNREKLLEIEPNISNEIFYGLYAPSAGIVSPYEFTICMAEQAVVNGAEIVLNENVVEISSNDGVFYCKTDKNEYNSKVVINCAGAGAVYIDKLVGINCNKMSYKRGDYFVLDSTEYKKFNHTCFPLPDEDGKGILVSPTADGNILVGPTSYSVDCGEDTATKSQGLDKIRKSVGKMLDNVDFRKVIRVFAGVRSSIGEDFIIKNAEENKNYIVVEGINSPGLTSAPAIAEYVVDELIKNTTLSFEYNENNNVYKRATLTRELTKDQLNEVISRDLHYCRIVCRCEKISEGDIISALKSPLPPKTLDAVKRRVRVGMGRCQGGFCTLRVMEIMAEFYGINIDQITKNGDGSQIIIGKIKQ